MNTSISSENELFTTAKKIQEYDKLLYRFHCELYDRLKEKIDENGDELELPTENDSYDSDDDEDFFSDFSVYWLHIQSSYGINQFETYIDNLKRQEMNKILDYARSNPDNLTLSEV